MDSIDFIQPSSFIFFLLIISIGYILVEIVWRNHYYFNGLLEKYRGNLFDRILHYVLIGLLFQSFLLLFISLTGGEVFINDLLKIGYDFSKGFKFDKDIAVNTLSIQLIFSSIVYFLYIVISISVIYVGVKIIEVLFYIIGLFIAWLSKKGFIASIIDFFIRNRLIKKLIPQKFLIFGFRILTIEKSIKQFISKDYSLLEYDVHEQSLSHRIAFYLERSGTYKKFDIDCEYNKSLRDPKAFRIKGSTPDLGSIKVYNKDGVLIESHGRVIHINSKYVIAYIKEGTEVVIGVLQEGPDATFLIVNSSLFRPDIVIHKRGSQKDNKVAFEIKKQKLSGIDKLKLEGLTKLGLSYEYEFGIGISEIERNSVRINIYVKGKEKLSYLYCF